MYEGIQSEVISATRFDENSDLNTTYLGKIDITRLSKIKVEEKNSYIRARVYDRKIIRWNRMSDTIGYRNKQIVHVQVTLFTMQIFTFHYQMDNLLVYCLLYQ